MTPEGDSAPTRTSTGWRIVLMEHVKFNQGLSRVLLLGRCSPRPRAHGMESSRDGLEGIWANPEVCSPLPGGLCATGSVSVEGGAPGRVPQSPVMSGHVTHGHCDTTCVTITTSAGQCQHTQAVTHSS